MKRITEQFIAEMMDDPDSLEDVSWIQRIDGERPCGLWHLWSRIWDGEEFGPYICACGESIDYDDDHRFSVPLSSQPEHDVCESCFVIAVALRF